MEAPAGLSQPKWRHQPRCEELQPAFLTASCAAVYRALRRDLNSNSPPFVSSGLCDFALCPELPRQYPHLKPAMTLPLKKSYPPMEALPATELPSGSEWQYEPKWDGFRCLAFRDGKHVDLMSKSQKPLTRYFPELVAALAALKAQRFVLDGEIVIPSDGGLSFDALLQRIHPAASRIEKLSKATPATFIVFDLLV